MTADDGGTFADLSGRVVAIAGVGGGLGPVVAERFAAAGATICGCDRDASAAEEAIAPLGLPADRADARAVDLLDEAATSAWCGALRERFGGVDCLLHLVGGWRGGQPLHESPLADWELLEKLLIRTVQHTSRAFHDALLASDHGRFILVSAKQAQAPTSSNAAYASAKAAAEAWTLALADGFAKTSATANVLVVEAILTPAMRERAAGDDHSAFTPAEHLAEAIAFVCSDAAEKMNGQRLRLTIN
ncbi:MAG TPA: SDR family NAD(P)-dependent oxidoreductase [Solirubrobacterales bacterium]|nr:SDR family NAD(P)-dependent oxidoreductase [Solirubrobacterales bacterium]